MTDGLQVGGAGRRVVVAGVSGPGAGIAAALAEGGARVAVLAPAGDAAVPGGSVHHIPCDFTSEGATKEAVAAAVEELGGVDQLVFAWYPSGLLQPTSFADIDEAEWARTCEGTLDAAWWLVRECIHPIRAAGRGSMVFVVPTVGLTGASELVMLATAAEGLRVMAKGCGRCWGGEGVVVNTVATSPALWVAPEHGQRLLREISLSVPAMGGVGDPGGDLAPLVRLLGSDDAHFLTAGTVVADGGLWMGL